MGLLGINLKKEIKYRKFLVFILGIKLIQHIIIIYFIRGRIMETKEKTWSFFNERIKFFFDSLRNLGISISVLIAAGYVERTGTLPSSAPSLEYIGCGLIIVSIIHFIVGTFVYFPIPKDLGINKKIWIVQIVFLFYYVLILYILYKFQIHVNAKY